MPKTRATVKDVTSTLAAAMCERPASFHGLPATASRGNGGATSQGATTPTATFDGLGDVGGGPLVLTHLTHPRTVAIPHDST
jgi:hypothetical protein